MLARLVIIAGLAMLAGGAVAQTAPLSVGLAEIEITPPLGYRMDGYFAERLSTGTKDPLKARALVFQQFRLKGVHKPEVAIWMPGFDQPQVLAEGLMPHWLP